MNYLTEIVCRSGKVFSLDRLPVLTLCKAREQKRHNDKQKIDYQGITPPRKTKRVAVQEQARAGLFWMIGCHEGLVFISFYD